MSAIQYLSSFVSNGWQALLLAVGVALVTFILKKTVKKLPEKIFTFLPFALGILFFAVYRALATLSWAPFTTDIATTLNGGFTCGCMATLCFVVCRQLMQKVGDRASASSESASASPVAPLLEGYVADDKLAETASALLEGCTGLAEEELPQFVRETLSAAVLPETTEAELLALCALVGAYLAQLTGN